MIRSGRIIFKRSNLNLFFQSNNFSSFLVLLRKIYYPQQQKQLLEKNIVSTRESTARNYFSTRRFSRARIDDDEVCKEVLFERLISHSNHLLGKKDFSSREIINTLFELKNMIPHISSRSEAMDTIDLLYNHLHDNSGVEKVNYLVFETVLECHAYFGNPFKARRVFEDWLRVFGGHIEHQPDTRGIELVFEAFKKSILKKDKRINLDFVEMNLREMKDFFTSCVSIFYEGNMYIRPMESIPTLSYMAICWSHYAQLLKEEEDEEAESFQTHSKKKDAAEKAHSLLNQVNNLVTKGSGKVSEKIVLECYFFVILAYLADGSIDAISIAIDLLNELQNSSLKTTRHGEDYIFFQKKILNQMLHSLNPKFFLRNEMQHHELLQEVLELAQIFDQDYFWLIKFSFYSQTTLQVEEFKTKFKHILDEISSKDELNLIEILLFKKNINKIQAHFIQILLLESSLLNPKSLSKNEVKHVCQQTLNLLEDTRQFDLSKALFFGLLNKSKALDAQALIEENQEKSYLPLKVCYTILIQSYAREQNIKACLDIFQQLRNSSICVDSHLYSSILNALVADINKNDDQIINFIEEKIWNKIPSEHKNKIVYSTMMHVFLKSSNVQKARDLLREMEQRCYYLKQVKPETDLVSYCPDLLIYTQIIHALSTRKNSATKVEACIRRIISRDLQVNDYIKCLRVIAWANHNPKSSKSLLKGNDYFVEMLNSLKIENLEILSHVRKAFGILLNAWCYNTNKNAPLEAENLLFLWERFLGKHNLKNIHRHYISVMNAWSRSKSEEKAVKAQKLLLRIKLSNSVDKATLRIAYGSLLKACSHSFKAAKHHQDKALQIAIDSFEELHSQSVLEPNIYRTFFSVLENLQQNKESDSTKNLLFKAFEKCYENGYLNAYVWNALSKNSQRQIVEFYRKQGIDIRYKKLL